MISKIRNITKLKGFVIVTILIVSLSITAVVMANHSWGKYHWNKSTADTTTNPLELSDNLSATWNSSLTQASNDWNESVLKTTVASGSANPNCDPTSGRIEVCNDAYGNNGWLGIASIWATRGKSAHIVQGVVKLNDSYFSLPQYNTQSWRDTVMCQEIGHTFGLDHQDENFYNTNLGTCMDYTADPDGTLADPDQETNVHPNQHDYDEMEAIYAHLNSTDDGDGGNDKGNNGKGGGRGKPEGVGANINLNDPTQWGEAIRQDAQGKNSLFRRNLPNNQVLITHVIWAN